MTRITVTGPAKAPARRRAGLAPLDLTSIATLQEGQDLDFKREVNLEKPEGKSRLLDDVVAFLNRGAARIIVGVNERQGRFDSYQPILGDPDKIALRMQTLIQDGILPLPVDVQVVPIHLEQGFVVDIQIPRHSGGPFMNRLTGSYVVRSGARNLPIDPGKLRSAFVDEVAWMTRLEELTAMEDVRVAEDGRMVTAQALRIGILPREHFDHRRAPFVQSDNFRSLGPNFHEHFRQWFVPCMDGHEAISVDLSQRGVERLIVRDDWFVHAHVAFAVGVTKGEGRLTLGEFDRDFQRYCRQLADFFTEQAIEGPFAVTLSLQSLNETEPMRIFFPRGATIRTLRPLIVDALDDSEIFAGFSRRVRQASAYGC